jgi:hypothetical protein
VQPQVLRAGESPIARSLDLDVLPRLPEDDLREPGLPIGARRKILHAAGARREQKAATRPPATDSHGSIPAVTPARRHITVIFTDIIGSTALSGQLDVEDFARSCSPTSRRVRKRSNTTGVVWLSTWAVESSLIRAIRRRIRTMRCPRYKRHSRSSRQDVEIYVVIGKGGHVLGEAEMVKRSSHATDVAHPLTGPLQGFPHTLGPGQDFAATILAGKARGLVRAWSVVKNNQHLYFRRVALRESSMAQVNHETGVECS